MSGDPKHPDGPMQGRCGVPKRSGGYCDNYPVQGLKRCRMHGGKSAAKLRAQGQVVVELRNWGLGDSTIDPGVLMLRLVSQSAARVERYSGLLEETYNAASAAEVGEILAPVAALIGHKYSATSKGDIYPAEEAITAMVELEAQERDRCANFSAKAIAAGLAEREVRIAEHMATLYGAQVVAAFWKLLDAIGATAAQRELMPTVAPDILREITVGDPVSVAS